MDEQKCGCDLCRGQLNSAYFFGDYFRMYTEDHAGAER